MPVMVHRRRLANSSTPVFLLGAILPHLKLARGNSCATTVALALFFEQAHQPPAFAMMHRTSDILSGRQGLPYSDAQKNVRLRSHLSA
jgi:hypothetical protein